MKTILAGLLVGLILASLLLVTIQAEKTLSSDVAETHNLITVPAFAVGPGGNRLRLEPAGPVNLTVDSAVNDQNPAWSPDGTTIVFQSDRSGNWDIWTMDMNRGTLTNVTNDPAEDTDPSWSPNGEWIVYSSDRGGDDGSIWAIEADEGSPIQVTDDPAYDGTPS